MAELTSKTARLAGHTNPNQRIHYTMQLKDQARARPEGSVLCRTPLASVPALVRVVDARERGLVHEKGVLDLHRLRNNAGLTHTTKTY